MAGDADALQRLIVHYHATLHGVVGGTVDTMLRRHVDPDDVLQQAYTSAFKVLTTPNRGGERAANQNRDREQAANQNRDREQAASQNRDRERAAAPAYHFDGPGHFYRWLEQIALNQLKDAQRALHRQKRNVARELPGRPDPTASYPNLVDRITDGQSTPSRQIARDEAIAAVMTGLARLSEDQREVVRLRILEDVPVAEIARRIGKTDVAIYALCRWGLKSLKELMGPITHYLSRL